MGDLVQHDGAKVILGARGVAVCTEVQLIAVIEILVVGHVHVWFARIQVASVEGVGQGRGVPGIGRRCAGEIPNIVTCSTITEDTLVQVSPAGIDNDGDRRVDQRLPYLGRVRESRLGRCGPGQAGGADGVRRACWQVGDRDVGSLNTQRGKSAGWRWRMVKADLGTGQKDHWRPASAELRDRLRSHLHRRGFLAQRCSNAVKATAEDQRYEQKQ